MLDVQAYGLSAKLCEALPMSFTEHPLRRWAVDEMRLRRFAPVSPHCEIYQVVRLIEPEERNSEDRWIFKGEILGHDPMATDRLMMEAQT